MERRDVIERREMSRVWVLKRVVRYGKILMRGIARRIWEYVRFERAFLFWRVRIMVSCSAKTILLDLDMCIHRKGSESEAGLMDGCKYTFFIESIW